MGGVRVGSKEVGGEGGRGIGTGVFLRHLDRCTAMCGVCVVFVCVWGVWGVWGVCGGCGMCVVCVVCVCGV